MFEGMLAQKEHPLLRKSSLPAHRIRSLAGIGTFAVPVSSVGPCALLIRSFVNIVCSEYD